MVRKLSNPDRQSAAFARSAEQQLAQLRKSLRSAEDSIAGLNRSLRVPVPRGGRRTTAATRTTPSVLDRAGFSALGNFLGRDITGDLGLGSGGFYSSASQVSSAWSGLFQLAQRIM